MELWWSALDPYMKVVWCITLVATLIFVIQMIMTFAGMDSDGGMDVDVDFDTAGDAADHSGPFQLFTFRNLVNFVLGMGWSLIALKGLFQSQLAWVLVSAALGVVLVTVIMLLFAFMSRMQQNGATNINMALGSRGNVYLTIPGGKQGEGKVQITLQKAIREFDALTDGETLPTGMPIIVTEVLNDSTLVVESLAGWESRNKK